MLGILVCTALSDGLIDKWTHTKPESIFRAGTAGKKSGQQATKKGKDVHNSEQLHIDPEGCLEIKEALEVSVLPQSCERGSMGSAPYFRLRRGGDGPKFVTSVFAVIHERQPIGNSV